MTDEPIAPDDPAPEPTPASRAGRPVGRLVRTGCIILGLLGAFFLFAGASSAGDPSKGRCAQSRLILEEEDDEVEDGGDVERDEAVDRAVALDEADGDEGEVDAVPTEAAIRTFGFIVAGVGLVQVVGAVLTARTRTRAARLVALAGCAVGIVFSPLGLFGILPLGFVVYALVFSADARAVFGDPGGPRLFRPRT